MKPTIDSCHNPHYAQEVTTCACLAPVAAYVCGKRVCKDGVVSDNLVFGYRKACDWYVRHYGCSVGMALLHKSERSLPCGKCAVCKIKARKALSVRLAHEISQHDKCCFITLTYDDEHIPANNGDYTLCVSDVQRFLKRLRRHLTYRPVKHKDGRDYVERIRYYCVGEYGSHTHRPHYHLLIFGWSPSDKVLLQVRNKVSSYRSAQVEKLWTNGFSVVEDVSPYVGKYVARYVTKKITTTWVPSLNQLPEFTLVSKRDGGIGAPWCDKYGAHACLSRLCTYRCGDFVCKASVPKYYYDRLRKRNIPLWTYCRDERIEWIKTHPDGCNRDFGALVRSVQVYQYEQHRRIRESEVL